MKTGPNLQQNLIALRQRKSRLEHMIKVLSENGMKSDHYTAELDDLLLVIAEVEGDL